MHSLGSIVVGTLVALCLVSTPALSLEIIYPADKTVVLRSNFLIIKGGEKPPLDAMILEINGIDSDPIDIGSDEYKAAFADFLILEPEWVKGKNSLSVKGLVGDKVVVEAKADLYYGGLEDPLSIIPKGYKPFVMHTPEKEALCSPCHNMQPTAAQLRGATPDSNPCGSCHKRMLAQDYVHGPEGVFQCVDCHDGKNKEQRWQVTKSELNMCGECHIDKIDDFKKNPFVHGPVAVGNCVLCHNPHASAEPAQLNAPVNRLCSGCHSSVKAGEHVIRGSSGKGHPLDRGKDPLREGRQMSCVSCHNPHSGMGSSLFVRDKVNRFSLCQECHKK